MRLAVLGVGLIGGSVGLAARGRCGAHVVAWDSDSDVLHRAAACGAIDRPAPSLARAVEGAAAVFVAAPVGALPEVVGAALAAAGPDTVVSDVGSTKRGVVAAHDDPRFVGGHPLAGAESSGVERARADLFDGATWYLTPTERTSGVLYERLHRLLGALGARPRAIDAARHDAILAAVSHLPHVLANVLVAGAARALEEEGEKLPAAGPSFRDAARVAGASSSIWTDIYIANADALTARIDDAVARLLEIRADLAAGDAGAVTAWNEEAGELRRRLLETELSGGPVHELRVSVPNKPGVVASLALELGREGVNISDMALYPAGDMRSGSVALWIAGDDAASRAEELLKRLGFPVGRP